MLLKRHILKEFLFLLKHFPAIGILGPRQSGKTTLAKIARKYINKESIYIDLELSRDFKRLADPESFLEKNSGKCIIIDEIQRMPDLFPSLRALIDMKRNPGRFVLLGSANPFLLRKASESLAGRIANLEISPLNFLEIENIKSFEEHWFKGGFPKSLLTKSERASQKWLSDFIATYLERDLPLLGLEGSAEIMLKFWTFLASAQGAIWNASNYAKSLGVSPPTVSKFLLYLQSSYMVFKLYPFYTNIKKRLVKSPKIYVRDSGILHNLCLIESYDSLQRNHLLGFSFEGYVIEQIRQLKKDNIQLCFYRTQDGTEVDLVFVKSIKPIATVEIKYSNAPEIRKSTFMSIKDLGTDNNFIITPNSEEYPAARNITVCNLKDFLKKHLPKIK